MPVNATAVGTIPRQTALPFLHVLDFANSIKSPWPRAEKPVRYHAAAPPLPGSYLYHSQLQNQHKRNIESQPSSSAADELAASPPTPVPAVETAPAAAPTATPPLSRHSRTHMNDSPFRRYQPQASMTPFTANGCVSISPHDHGRTPGQLQPGFLANKASDVLVDIKASRKAAFAPTRTEMVAVPVQAPARSMLRIS
jgi:hypothetical protein